MLGVSAMTACVTTPEPAGPPRFREPAKGLALPQSGVVAFFVSPEIAPAREGDKADVSAIGDTAAVAQRFRKGFLEMRPDANVTEADAELRAACFERGGMAIEAGHVVLSIPALADERCRASVSAQSVAYLVAIGGARETGSSSNVEYGIVSVDHGHHFRLLARTFDAQSGASVCDAAVFDSGRSAEGIVFLPYWIPVPFARFIDASAFWSELGLRAGRVTGWCFVAPGASG